MMRLAELSGWLSLEVNQGVDRSGVEGSCSAARSGPSGSEPVGWRTPFPELIRLQLRCGAWGKIGRIDQGGDARPEV
jgi:hypothetical protein